MRLRWLPPVLRSFSMGAGVVAMLSSCMGDSTLWVSGQVVHADGTPLHGNCVVTLKVVDEHWTGTPHTVEARWKIEYVVSPRPTHYFVEAACGDGAKGVSKPFDFPLRDRARTEVDVGSISVR